MSVLIKGLFGKDMPMPQEGFVDIRIHFKSGKLKRVTMPTGEDPFYATFDVEKLPPHGRLGDLDELEKQFKRAIGTYLPKDPTRHMSVTDSCECRGWAQGLTAVQGAPTVIEAEGES